LTRTACYILPRRSGSSCRVQLEVESTDSLNRLRILSCLIKYLLCQRGEGQINKSDSVPMRGNVTDVVWLLLPEQQSCIVSQIRNTCGEDQSEQMTQAVKGRGCKNQNP